MPTSLAETIAIRIPKELYDLLKSEAERLDKSIAETAREWLKEYAKRVAKK